MRRVAVTVGRNYPIPNVNLERIKQEFRPAEYDLSESDQLQLNHWVEQFELHCIQLWGCFPKKGYMK